MSRKFASSLALSVLAMLASVALGLLIIKMSGVPAFGPTHSDRTVQPIRNEIPDRRDESDDLEALSA